MLDPEAVAAGKQTDLDEAGIAKTAREEKLRARAEAKKKSDPENERDGRALSPARAQGSSRRTGLQIQGLGGQEEADVQEVLHKPQQ